jgi:hypothetical protein
MKTFFLVFLLLPVATWASVMGVSTHPFNDETRVISAEMTGYMSQRHEMGMGLRYSHEVSRYRMLDFSVAGGQDSRGLVMGGGMDMELLSEELYQPRVSVKPFMQYQKFEDEAFNLMGAAPSLRKGFSVQGQEFFPYVAVPMGIKIDSTSDEFVYYASMTLGMSMPFPGAQNEKILLSFEGNKNMGASADYLGCLVSWIWN